MRAALQTTGCAVCGTDLAPGTLSGLCPKCVATAILGAETAPRLKLPPGMVREFGDYELIEEIARGGMGVVFKARQRNLKRWVAIKIILSGQLASATQLQRFRAEAEAAANLQHPNLVPIHEIGEQDGLPFISMDYVEGRTLAELGQAGPLTNERAACYVKTLAEAVHYAHQNGTVHRDLKPCNVLVDSFDQPRILDFGLAKRLEAETQLTMTGEVLGTPSYMAPEQAAAQPRAVGPHSDIYSLGAILYYLLTAQPPYSGETREATLHALLHAEPVPPGRLNPRVARDLETICLKCLQKEPAHRYPSAQALAEDLDRFLHGKTIAAKPPTAQEKLLRWCRQHKTVAILAACLLLMTIALAAVLFINVQDQRNSRGSAGFPPVSALPTNLARIPVSYGSAGGVSAVIDGKIYLTSPLDGYPGTRNHFHAYDPAPNVWLPPLSATPEPHAGATAAAAIDGKFYLTAGFDETGRADGRLYIYDPKLDDWTLGAPMPTPRTHVAGAVLAGELYVLGGQSNSGTTALRTVEVYNPRSDRWRAGPELPEGRVGFGAAQIGGMLFAVSGVGSAEQGLRSNLWALLPSGTWVEKAPIPVPATGSSVATFDGLLYVAGGSNNGDLARLQVYDPRRNTWEQRAPLPAARYSCSAFQLVGGQLYLFGGSTTKTATDPGLPHSDVFAYDPLRNEWRR